MTALKANISSQMVLPIEIGDAAQDGDRDRVIAWLAAGGSINDVDFQGYTLVNCCICGDRGSEVVNDRHVALARHLIGLGADVNFANRLALAWRETSIGKG